ncbi:LysR substrate-binding domain-containing protein [Alkalimonas amylolytica]|uniref:LysR family transcriptional regulator, regulator for metE and metH n=1 Tax=Alkalimonas amylolytica TaxID=152573 RepID=A0A1H4B2U2_ALKAM|nr:LysR substrate-binding domain-containing protein [Alkalimonas amylolytica]SEA42441.1 LysR family transcriptional regulator, regulator for metE and metH [Alkalimonas amylolytica]
MVELKHLKAIQALRDTGSVSAAANLLCLTQSALSHQLKELEHRLEQGLFERKTEPLQFLPAGQLLLQLAEQVLPAVRAAEQSLKQGMQASKCEIRFCVECHACYHWLLPAIKAFLHQEPDLELDLSASIQHQAIEALLQDELDLVVTSDQRLLQHVHYHYLYPMELRLLVSPEHPLARQSWLQPEQLLQQTILSYPVPQQRQDLFRFFLAQHAFQGRVKPIEQGSQMIQQVAANQGVAVLPSWMAEPYLQQGLIASLALGEEGVWRPMYLAWRLQDRLEPAYQRLAALLQQLLPQQAQSS